ncbi:MAG: DUF4329 domain-containing protein [Gemmataceae bacterium]|nr:DUF4329 domain-containing protein [Gemmataceae bacterium]
MAAPSKPPTAAELAADPAVVAALKQAWSDSEPGDPSARHEEGGWVYLDLASGAVTTRRAARGKTAMIRLDQPPVVAGSVVVGKFHTHPNPAAEGWNPGPSRDDLLVDAAHGVPDLIQADDGLHFSGPPERRGGLGGGPGFPPP